MYTRLNVFLPLKNLFWIDKSRMEISLRSSLKSLHQNRRLSSSESKIIPRWQRAERAHRYQHDVTVCLHIRNLTTPKSPLLLFFWNQLARQRWSIYIFFLNKGILVLMNTINRGLPILLVWNGKLLELLDHVSPIVIS